MNKFLGWLASFSLKFLFGWLQLLRSEAKAKKADDLERQLDYQTQSSAAERRANDEIINADNRNTVSRLRNGGF